MVRVFLRQPSGNLSAEDHPKQGSSRKRLPRSRRACSFIIIIVLVYLLFSWPRVKSEHPFFCAKYPEECTQIAPFIFDSVFSFLKQWHNTFAPNGHSMVKAWVPPNIQLFHAQSSGNLPPKRAFFAFDAEMSIGIYGSAGVTILLTMVTTRRMDLLYLDGQSASLTNAGSLDSQTALLRGSVPLNPGDEYIYDDYTRAERLCDLVDELGIDGVVRMNAGFELLLCDWESAGVEFAIGSNITIPENHKRKKDADLPQDPNRSPPQGFGNMFAEQNSWEWIRSSVWHYGSSATRGGGMYERRVKLDYCGIVTFYDPALSSLKGAHHGGIRGSETFQNGWGLRRGHRLLDISKTDVKTVRRWLREVTSFRSYSSFPTGSARTSKCSGTDWQVITELIVDQYRSRALEILGFLDRAKQHSISAEKAVEKVHDLSHAIVYSYLQYPSSAGLDEVTVKQQTIERCASIYTDNLHGLMLNEFESLIKASIHIVLENLCHWAWGLFEWSEKHTSNLMVSSVSPERASGRTQSPKLLAEIREQAEATASMLSWIGWDLWQDCEVKCSWEELCYIPMWPVIYAPGKHQGGIYGGSNFTEKEMSDFWKPKCIDKESFDKGGGRARDPWHRLPDVFNDGRETRKT